MPLSNAALHNVLRMILKSEHYRRAVVDEISSDLMRFTVRFFKDIAYAKLEGIELDFDQDWYKRYFLDGRFSAKETAIFSGLNDKTIRNIYGRADREFVLNIAPEYHDELLDRVATLLNNEFGNVRVGLTLHYNEFRVELNMRETLLVVNTLGVKHSEIRGGAWSGLGKKLELPLMLTLTKLYCVASNYYAGKGLSGEGRDVDFHFLSLSGQRYRCEVKLMGKGNPESADAIIARGTDIFVADSLSTLNKEQLAQRNCQWVELRAYEGYKKSFDVFTQLDVPCIEFTGDLDTALDDIIPVVFAEID